MCDKKALIEKQVSQLKLLTDGAVNAWVKHWLKEEDYENKKAKGQLTQEWFDKLLKKMKDQFTNLNPWVGELSFQCLVLKDNEEIQDYYSRVYLEGRKLGKSDQDVANAFLRGLPFTYQVHVLNQKPTTAAQYVDAAWTYESMCKLGNAEAARLKPSPLKIATISGTSPLHEVTRAIDQTARESITQMTEAIKTMGKIIDKNENENKQLKKKVSQLAPSLQYCTYCNRSGHTDSICQTKIANEQNQSANSYLNSRSYNTLNQSTRKLQSFIKLQSAISFARKLFLTTSLSGSRSKAKLSGTTASKLSGGVGTRIEDGMIEGGIMVVELIQIVEILDMEEVEMLTVKIGEEILDKVQMGIKITDPLWETNRH